MGYKVLYHQGNEVGLKTKARVARLSLEGGRVLIRDEPEVLIPFEALHSVEILRLHGTARMLKVTHEEGTLFVAVIRFSMFGFFAVVNFFATGRLHKELQAAILALKCPRNERTTGRPGTGGGDPAQAGKDGGG